MLRLLPFHQVCPWILALLHGLPGTIRFLSGTGPPRQVPGPRPSRTGTQQDLPLDAMGPSCWILGLCFAQLFKCKAVSQKAHPGKTCSSAESLQVLLISSAARHPPFRHTERTKPHSFKFTAVQNKCVNSMEFVYLILLYNTLNLIPSKRNNLAKTSLNSLIRTGWLILFEQMDYFAIRSTNVNQLYF